MSVLSDIGSKLWDKAKDNVVLLLITITTLIAGSLVATFRSFTESYVTSVVAAQLKNKDSEISAALNDASRRSLGDEKDPLRKQVEDLASEVIKRDKLSAVGLWTSGSALLTSTQRAHEFFVFFPDNASHASLFLDIEWHYARSDDEELRIYVDGRPTREPIKSSHNYKLDLAKLIRNASKDAQPEVEPDPAARPDLGALDRLHSIAIHLTNGPGNVAGVAVRYMAIVQPTMHLNTNS